MSVSILLFGLFIYSKAAKNAKIHKILIIFFVRYAKTSITLTWPANEVIRVDQFWHMCALCVYVHRFPSHFHPQFPLEKSYTFFSHHAIDCDDIRCQCAVCAPMSSKITFSQACTIEEKSFCVCVYLLVSSVAYHGARVYCWY